MHSALQTAIIDHLNADSFFIGPKTIVPRAISMDGDHAKHLTALINQDIDKTGLAVIIGFPLDEPIADVRILPLTIHIGIAENTVINRGDIGTKQSIDCVIDNILRLLVNTGLPPYMPLAYEGKEAISEPPQEVLEYDLTFSTKTIV